ncbi:MAG: PepSY domain-containing protein [Proteobacteria bacterium]|nr:PepSY domain-containing protein [Pseudomonadota bacterium]
MRKILKKLHLYLALILCIPLILQGITGATLVFQREISDAILRKNYQLAEGEKVEKNLIIEAGKKIAPPEFVLQSVKISAAAILRFGKNGEKKELIEVLLDPVSLDVLEVRNPDKNFFRIVKKFHASLLIPGEIGKNIVGIFGIVMAFICVSGLVIWWPKQKFSRQAFTFKFAAKGRQFHRGVHGAFGIWFLIPLSVTSVTGIYLIYFKTKDSNKIWQAIHEGSVLGLFSQVEVFLVGLLPLLFSITGICLWWIKKRDRKISA